MKETNMNQPTTLVPEGKTEIEQNLKVQSEQPLKEKKISKTEFIVNLWNGRPGREGDEVPAGPVQEVKAIATLVGDAEAKGYFRTRIDIKLERNEAKYLSETKWYLTQAAKKGLIDRKYTPRVKKETQQAQ